MGYVLIGHSHCFGLKKQLRTIELIGSKEFIYSIKTNIVLKYARNTTNKTPFLISCAQPEAI